MFDLTEPEKTLLHEVWGIVNDRWWGPVPNEHFASRQDQVAAYESLLLKNLLTQQSDPAGVFRMRFQQQGFFYLGIKAQQEATKGTLQLIAGAKKLYSLKKGSRASIAELAKESGLSVGESFRLLFLMRQFGLSISAQLEDGPEATKTWVAPDIQVSKITTFEALYEQRKKEHESQAEEMKKWSGLVAPKKHPIAQVVPGLYEASSSDPEEETEQPEIPGSLTVLCERCGRATNHKILGQVKEREKLPEELDQFKVDHEWQIIRCQGCDETRFRYHILSTEYYLIEVPGNKESGSKELIYPTPQKWKPKDLLHAPAVIRELYFQTTKALNEGMNHLCAGGLRAIVEAICSEQGIISGWVLDEVTFVRKRNANGQEYKNDGLAGKIWGLAEKGLMTTADAAVLHKHRYLGNDALHDAFAPSFQSLENALGVIEHFLEKLYELPAKAANITLAKP